MESLEHNRALSTAQSKIRSQSNNAVLNKSYRRPDSRASTTSINSASHQPGFEHQAVENEADYQRQWFETAEAGRRQTDAASRIEQDVSAGAIVMQSAQHNQNSAGQHDFGIDPSLGTSVDHPSTYSHGPYKRDARHSLPTDGYGTSFVEDDSPLLDGRSDGQDDMDSAAGVTELGRKAPKSSAANEMEMRQLFHTNKHRTLPDVARELHGNERGPQSERTRQVFAMLWINQVCDKGKGSVPRGRVYANYVSRCATERVTVLNPASFGKLVRVLFPGLKTRRLGVRGESKYHYVNFSLKEDQPELVERQSVAPSLVFEDVARVIQPSRSQHPQLTADRAVFPSARLAPRDNEKARQRPQDFTQSRSLYSQPVVHNMQQVESSTRKMTQRLRFAQAGETAIHEYEPITLPKIEPYVPVGTDPDSAGALTALYRSHCTSLVDAIRFVKQKTFFHLFTSFHGTLTMPVQKLFANPSIAQWIEECDFVMYQKMMRVVAHLTLEVVPQAILDTLHQISERLVPHIQSSFQALPSHVIQAKTAPATLFSGLLDRMCRVNLTAHAAANMLSHPPNRDQMYEDWITMVRLRKVAESVPTKAMDDVVNLLLSELRDLLDPTSVSWEIESMTPYGEMAMRSGRQEQSNIHADASTENVLDRWVNFLVAIPERFPYASPTEIVWCVERVGSAVMRDLTIRSGQSFGAWWVTKCWIDEMISFMAEKGGFMEYKSVSGPGAQLLEHGPSTGIDISNRASFPMNANDFTRGRMTTIHDGLPTINDQTIIVQGPMASASQAAMNAAAGHDDSAIGMRTPDEEFSLSKFGFTDANMAGSEITA